MKPVEVLQRNKFLIGVGVLVVAGIGAGIGLFVPMHRANAQSATDLKGKATSLVTYAAKQDLAPKAAVAEAGKLKEAYQGDLDDLRKQLEGKAQPLNEPLREANAAADTGQLDGSTWKLVYKQDVDGLLDSLTKSFLVVGANPVVAQSYGDDIPSPDEVATQTRYLLVQKYAVESMAGLNTPPTSYVVPVFNGFSFLSAPERLLSPIHGQDFVPIPFEMHVSTDFGNIPRVLCALLSSPVQFEITSIAVERPGRFDREGAKMPAWAERTKTAAVAPKAPAAGTEVAAGTAPGQPQTPASIVTGPAAVGGPPSAQEAQARGAAMAAAGQARGAAAAAAAVQQQAAAAAAGAARGIEIGRQMGAMMAARRGGMGARSGPTTALPSPVGPAVPAATTKRTTSVLTKQATEVTTSIKAQLPKTLVDLTIRGYVAEYKKKAS